jgi:hypothetical protein
VRGDGKQIAADPRGNVWVVASDNTIWRFNAADGGFGQVQGLLKDIAIGPDGNGLGRGARRDHLAMLAQA